MPHVTTKTASSHGCRRFFTVRSAHMVSTATVRATARPHFFPLRGTSRRAVRRGQSRGIHQARGATGNAILAARQIDRPIRPLFPEGYKDDIQLVVTVLSTDQENLPDIVGTIAASAALTISEIPFNGPIASVRVGHIDGEFVVNPTFTELRLEARPHRRRHARRDIGSRRRQSPA